MTKAELLRSVGCPATVEAHGTAPCEHCGATARDLEPDQYPESMGFDEAGFLRWKLETRKGIRLALKHWRK